MVLTDSFVVGKVVHKGDTIFITTIGEEGAVRF